MCAIITLNNRNRSHLRIRIGMVDGMCIDSRCIIRIRNRVIVNRRARIRTRNRYRTVGGNRS